MINRFADEQAALSSLVDSVTTFIGDVKSGITNIVKTTSLKG